MKRSRFSDEQIIGVLKEHRAGLSANELCRKYGISDATFYEWRGMEVSEAAEEPRGGEREAEAPPGRRHARRLDVARDARKKLLTPGLRRSAVTWAIDNKGYSQRRACGLLGMEPRVYRYRSSRPDDAALRVRLRKLAAERRRFGYRRLHLLLKREGVAINWKKLYRLYKEERLTVRKRGGRKRSLGTRAPMAIPQGANQRWSLDFVPDTLTDDRR